MSKKSLYSNLLAAMIVLLFFSIGIQNIQAQNQLSVSINVYNEGEYTHINGIVKDPDQNPVPVAAVSIQAINPEGKIVHVSLVYTNQSGQFTDRFKTSEQLWFDGEGTIYISAAKAGYENATTSATFTAIPEFSIVFIVVIISILLTLAVSRKVSIFQRPKICHHY